MHVHVVSKTVHGFKLLVQLLNLKTNMFSFKVKIITIPIIAVKIMLKNMLPLLTQTNYDSK